MLKENGIPPAKFDVDTLTAFRVVAEATVENVPVSGDVNGGVNRGINTEEKKNDVENSQNGDVNVAENSQNGEINGGINALSPKLKQIYDTIKNNVHIK